MVEGVATSAERKYNVNAISVPGGVSVNNVGGVDIERTTVVCSQTQRFNTFTNTCMDGAPYKEPGQNGANNGSSCPSCGKPINPMTGNMWHVIEDYKAPADDGLSIVRTYNSTPWLWKATRIWGFGPRWNDRYNVVLRAAPPRLPDVEYECWKFTNGQEICPELYTPTVAGPFPNTIVPPEAVSIQRPDGKVYSFSAMTGGYQGDSNVNAKVKPIYAADGVSIAGWTYVDTDNASSETFDYIGLLLSINARGGSVQRLTYSNGVTNDTTIGRYPADAPTCTATPSGTILPEHTLLCVTDSYGRQIQYRYDAKGRISELIDPAMRSYFYEYDGPSGGCVPGAVSSPACTANNLTKVSYPDGTSQTYFYNEASNINNGANCSAIGVAPVGNGFGQFVDKMTGLVDEKGTRWLTWTYNCNGLATSSQEVNGVNKVELTYSAFGVGGTLTTTVANTVGSPASPQKTTRTFSNMFILGVGKNVGIDQPCVECGSIKSRTYDAKGNVASATDFNGNVTTFTYDPQRNFEISRTEAFGTPLARTVSTAWHPDYRLPISIVEPGRSTTFTYDQSLNVVQKSITANGQTRTWTFTYNSTGQILSMTGPRTDVVSTTRFSYDAAGNIATVTDAAGHVTTLSNYDANGRVGRSVDANGKATDFTYSPRGWLVAVSDGGQLTSFERDALGQVTKVTMPDGSVLNYTYDDAHRLTGLTDAIGNSIHYTLDLTGNRTAEQVMDPNGVLTRQTARTFDTLNRLQQVTGAQQ